jgi:hypothetical protein
MRRQAAVLLVVGALLAGCGGGGGVGVSSDTPKGSVQSFLAAVHGSDWKAACARLSVMGRVEVSNRLAIFGSDELDKFGLLKDCPASLGKHADLLRQKLERTDPGATRRLAANAARVSSPRGEWSVDTTEKAGEWRISGIPTGN